MRKGITLIELMVTVAIIAVLAGIAYVSYGKWKAKYSVESDVKKLYSFIQSARMKAFSEKEDLKVEVSGHSAFLKNSSNSTVKVLNLNNSFNGTVSISSRGVFSTNGSIYYTGPDVHSDYDCLAVSFTRVRMGNWDGANCMPR